MSQRRVLLRHLRRPYKPMPCGAWLSYDVPFKFSGKLDKVVINLK